MKRRDYLKKTGAKAGAVAGAYLAGCSAPGGSSDSGNDTQISEDEIQQSENQSLKETGKEVLEENNGKQTDSGNDEAFVEESGYGEICSDSFYFETGEDPQDLPFDEEETYFTVDAVMKTGEHGGINFYRAIISEYNDENGEELVTRHIIERNGLENTSSSNQFPYEVESLMGTDHEEQEGIVGIKPQDCH